MIMLIKKIALVGFAIALTGCANTEGLEQQVTSLSQTVNSLSSKVDGLSGKVEDLQAKQESTSSATEAALTTAQEANERVSNFVDSYKK